MLDYKLLDNNRIQIWSNERIGILYTIQSMTLENSGSFVDLTDYYKKFEVNKILNDMNDAIAGEATDVVVASWIDINVDDMQLKMVEIAHSLGDDIKNMTVDIFAKDGSYVMSTFQALPGSKIRVYSEASIDATVIIKAARISDILPDTDVVEMFTLNGTSRVHQLEKEVFELKIMVNQLLNKK